MDVKDVTDWLNILEKNARSVNDDHGLPLAEKCVEIENFLLERFDKLHELVELMEESCAMNLLALSRLGYVNGEHEYMAYARASTKEAARCYGECADKLKRILECEINPVLSRVCERGTASCSVQHPEYCGFDGNLRPCPHHDRSFS